MTREEAKDLFRNDKDAYGKPRGIMHKIDDIFDSFEAEMKQVASKGTFMETVDPVYREELEARADKVEKALERSGAMSTEMAGVGYILYERHKKEALIISNETERVGGKKGYSERDYRIDAARKKQILKSLEEITEMEATSPPPVRVGTSYKKMLEKTRGLLSKELDALETRMKQYTPNEEAKQE